MAAPTRPSRAKNRHLSKMANQPQIPARPDASLGEFMLTHKGDLTLALSLAVYLASGAMLTFTRLHRSAEIAVSIAEAALIGGLCDYIALKMIFERRWYLPNSGVLPRNRQKLIEGISSTIEKQWLTPEMIDKKLRDLDLVKRLGRYLEDVSLESIIDRTHLAGLCQSIARYVESPELLDFLEERLEAS